MQALAQFTTKLVTSLSAVISAKSHKIHPVWSNSTSKPVPFQPVSKLAATRLWHRARDFDRITRQPGHHGGAIGHAALQVLHALIFDFLNHKSGRLDPSYAAIARKANLCERTVATALQRLKRLGILEWKRRCQESWQDGRLVREQETNAYTLQPWPEWKGYKPQTEAPAPMTGTWGDPPYMLDVLDEAANEQDMKSKINILGNAPPNGLEAALAKLGGTMLAAGKS